jgi:glycerol-3-phosphate cytidylyltransferase
MIGIIAGNFDIIHPGYIKMFKDAKKRCDKLIVLLHTDPSIERPEKHKPILSVDERAETLEAIRYIDEVIPYTYEKELYELFKENSPHIRILGTDYINKSFTGDDLKNEIYFITREHGWSTTKFKNLIKKQK